MKRAERQRYERAAEEGARKSAEWLGLKALLDRRIPASESLVIDMKSPLLTSEFLAHGKGPTGVAHASDVMRRYAGVIAQRTGGDAQAVQRHFTELIGKERAATLGINLGKLKITSQLGAGGAPTLAIKLSDQETVALAGYLVSPDHLNFGNLPPNPFGSRRVADLMDRIKALYPRMRTAPEHPYTVSGGPTVYQLQNSIAKYGDLAANEISRALPSNAVREAALTAMRLDKSLELYTLQVVQQTGWRSIQVREIATATGQPGPVTQRIAVYKTAPGGPDSPTRYRPRLDTQTAVSSPGTRAAGALLNLYGT